jgi:hypothetical protein
MLMKLNGDVNCGRYSAALPSVPAGQPAHVAVAAVMTDVGVLK